ncbi:VWA domain-containing protein [Halovulum sp. GXIMD14793]
MAGGKKQKVGNRYYLGIHFVLAQALDAIIEIRMAQKSLWKGYWGTGRLSIHKPKHMGGDEREGGFSGSMDLMKGEADQPANDYLLSLYKGLGIAFRGVVSVVFRRPYIGANTARLSPTAFKAVRVSELLDWEPETAIVSVEQEVEGAAIYIAMDASASMAGFRFENQKIAMASFVRSLRGTRNDIKIVTWAWNVIDVIERFGCRDDDYEEIALWIEALNTTANLTNFDAGVSLAADFFVDADNSLTEPGDFKNLISNLFGGTRDAKASKRRVIIFTTDGAPDASSEFTAAETVAAIGGVEVFAFNIDLADTSATAVLDNTPIDGVPVINGGDAGAISRALAGAFPVWMDINGIHAIRYILTQKGQYSADDIGGSFAIAAQKVFDEGFGISEFSRTTGSQEDRRYEIERHLDATTYLSTETGKWEVELIRDGFDVGALPVYDSSIVTEWSGLERPLPSEMPNQMTTRYTNRKTGEAASVTRASVAGVRRAGTVIPSEPRDYFFVSDPALAVRLCLRDLAVVSTPLLSGNLPLSYLPADAHPGQVIVLHEPRVGLDNVVVRITETDGGNGRENAGSINVVQHSFTLGQEVIDTGGDDPNGQDYAEPATPRFVEEAPYYTLVTSEGQAVVDQSLDNEPDGGRLLVVAGSPGSNHIDATKAVDAGSGFEDFGVLEFSPHVRIVNGLSGDADDTTLLVEDSSTLTGLEVGDLASIGSEIVRIDAATEQPDLFTIGDFFSVENVFGQMSALTIGRGCLDTVPAVHGAGQDLLIMEGEEPESTTYLAGESVDVKLLTQTDLDVLPISAAPTDEVEFGSRAVRPYPPGRFQLDGQYSLTDIVSGSLIGTWAHRNRLTQTTATVEDYTVGDIGPELGVTYIPMLRSVDASGDMFSAADFFSASDLFAGEGSDNLHEFAALSATSFPFPADGIRFFDAPDFFSQADVFAGGVTEQTVALEFGVKSIRDGYENWQTKWVRAIPLLPPINLSISEVT